MPDSVPDSTDWLSTPLSGFAAVEAALRCQVCKDLFKTPMMTSCSHTFCSLCIRRALSSDGKCPLCRSAEQELKLRSNWAMEETVAAFASARDAALELARGHDKVAGKRAVEDDEDEDEREPKRLRRSRRERPVHLSDDEDYVPDGLVPCPMCRKPMKEWQVFNHVESCTGPTPPRQQQQQQQQAFERLPPLNYSMLRDGALRKKVAELGISSHGSRVVLERRHREWLTIWNANCDANVPRKRSELLRDLDVWERTQGSRAAAAAGVPGRVCVKDKDFDGAAWAAKHRADYRELIASARRTKLCGSKPDNTDEKEAASSSHAWPEKQRVLVVHHSPSRVSEPGQPHVPP